MLVGEGGDTADPDVGLVVARFAGPLHGHHTGQTACYHGGQAGRWHLDLLGLDGSLGTHHGNLALGTITYHHDFVQFVDHRDERHVNDGAPVHRNLLLLEPEGRENKDRVDACRGNAVLTVCIGKGTARGTFLVHSNTCKQLTLLIRNTTGYLERLCSRHDTRGDEDHHCQPEPAGEGLV